MCRHLQFENTSAAANLHPMNLAILIGVDSYNKPVSDLPACKNDVDLMSQLLRHTDKFPNTLEFSTGTSSAEVKTQLAQFISKFKGQPVEELFFYFSGHGDLFKDDFYFLLSDFDEKRRNQTCLTNDELDSMLKTLSPKLMIKVVDACHAGVSYVKEADALAKQLQVSKGSFSDCYFMFSSQSSQSSLQDSKLSDFTEAFVEACATFTGQDIRYKDIVDHIADAFVGNADQTPTFVIQAPCVEIFCTVDDPIRKLRPSRTTTSGSPTATTGLRQTAISDAIKVSAAEFSNKEEVLAFMTKLGEQLTHVEFKSELREAYKLVAQTSEGYQGIPNLGPVGQWIFEHGTDFFAKPTYITQTYEAPEESLLYYRPVGSVLGPTFGLQGSSPPPKMVKKQREIISGVDCTAQTPFKSIRITAFPNFENLPHAVAVIVPLFSKKDCLLFYMFQTVKELDWGKLAALESRKWNYTKVIMKKDPDARLASTDVTHKFELFLTKVTKEKLGLEDEKQDKPKKLAPPKDKPDVAK